MPSHAGRESAATPRIAAARFRLNQDYDYFTGHSARSPTATNVRTFAGDPDLPLLLSLKNYRRGHQHCDKDGHLSRTHHPASHPVAQAAGAKVGPARRAQREGPCRSGAHRPVAREAAGGVSAGAGRGYLPQPGVTPMGELTTNTCPATSAKNWPSPSALAESDPSLRVQCGGAARGPTHRSRRPSEIDARLGAVMDSGRRHRRVSPVNCFVFPGETRTS
jgi:hypothetical protein